MENVQLSTPNKEITQSNIKIIIKTENIDVWKSLDFIWVIPEGNEDSCAQ